MSDKVVVTLTGPAKVDGRWKKAGDTVAVASDLVAQLPIVGVAPSASMVTIGESIEAAVDARLGAALTQATAGLQEQLRATEARAVEAEAQRDLLQGRVLELQAQIVATIDADTAQPDPVEQDTEAAKTTSKKTGSGA